MSTTPSVHEQMSVVGNTMDEQNLPALEKQESVDSEIGDAQTTHETAALSKNEMKSSEVQAAIPSAGTGFPRFRDLPPEIRDMIWIETLPRRIVECDSGGETGWRSPCAPPVILFVCQESRKLALFKGPKRVKLLFDFLESEHAQWPFQEEEVFARPEQDFVADAPNVFFDFKRDALYFRAWLRHCDPVPNGTGLIMRQKDINRVENVAINVTELLRKHVRSQYDYLAAFPNLKSITLVSDQDTKGQHMIPHVDNYYPSFQEVQNGLRQYAIQFRKETLEELRKTSPEGKVAQKALDVLNNLTIVVRSNQMRSETWSEKEKKKFREKRVRRIHNKAVDLDSVLWQQFYQVHPPYIKHSCSLRPVGDQDIADTLCALDTNPGYLSIQFPGTYMISECMAMLEDPTTLMHQYREKIRTIQKSYGSEARTQCSGVHDDPKGFGLATRLSWDDRKPEPVCEHREDMYKMFMELVQKWDAKFHRDALLASPETLPTLEEMEKAEADKNPTLEGNEKTEADENRKFPFSSPAWQLR